MDDACLTLYVDQIAITMVNRIYWLYRSIEYSFSYDQYLLYIPYSGKFLRTVNFTVFMDFTSTMKIIFNQACAGRRPARTWFLKIVSVWMSVCVSVCVSAPEAINN